MATALAVTKVMTIFTGMSMLVFATAAYAQDGDANGAEIAATPNDLIVVESLKPATGEAASFTEEISDEDAEPSADEIADLLNSQQQLQQTFTLKRTINGEVVETEKRTVTYNRDIPFRETEAGISTLEAVKAAFDGEVLTRTEAFEEAKLDFTVADIDRSGTLTSDEFTALVDSWRQIDTRHAAAPDAETARQRQYDAFLEEIDPDATALQHQTIAKDKFAFMAGADQTITREDYIREYLLDFDSMDADKDTLLKGAELMRFRALNRGETIEM